MLLRLYNDDTPLMDHSKDRFNKTANISSDSLSPEAVNDAEMEEVAEKEAEEKLTVAKTHNNTNLQSDDDDDDDEGGVAIGTAGVTAGATGLGSGVGSGATMEQYGSSTGMDNVRE